MRYRFDNLSKVPAVTVPMLIVNGARDTLVPTPMSDRLAAAAGGPVTRVTIGTADHNDIFTAEPDVVWAALRRLVDRVSR